MGMLPEISESPSDRIRWALTHGWVFVLSASGLARAAPRPYQVAHEVIGLYQREAIRKYGGEIYLKVDQTRGRPNAYASFHGPEGRPQIRVLVSTFEQFKGDTIAGTLCHELGHFFGDTSRGTRDGVLTLESEADYFEGECLLRYFIDVHGVSATEAESRAAQTATEEAEAFEGRVIDPAIGAHQSYTGGPTDHPPPECRLLTVLNRVHGRARPDCIRGAHGFSPN
jgi:hypothetical protein